MSVSLPSSVAAGIVSALSSLVNSVSLTATGASLTGVMSSEAEPATLPPAPSLML